MSFDAVFGLSDLLEQGLLFQSCISAVPRLPFAAGMREQLATIVFQFTDVWSCFPFDHSRQAVDAFRVEVIVGKNTGGIPIVFLENSSFLYIRQGSFDHTLGVDSCPFTDRSNVLLFCRRCVHRGCNQGEFQRYSGLSVLVSAGWRVSRLLRRSV